MPPSPSARLFDVDVVLSRPGAVLARPGAPSAVGGVTLVATAAGLTVIGPSGAPVAEIAWEATTWLAPGGDVPGGLLAEGRTPFTLSTCDRCHRFVAPTEGLEPFLSAALALAAGPPSTPTGVHGPAGGPAVVAPLFLGGTDAGPVACPPGSPAPWYARARRQATADRFRRRGRRARRRTPAHRRRGREGRRHGRRLSVPPLAVCLGALVLVAAGALLGTIATGGAVAAPAASLAGGPGDSVPIMHRMDQAYAGPTAVALPAATAPPEPAPPSLAGAPALRPHEVFGFAPYWTLPDATGFDLAGVTTLAYFSVDVNGNGSIAESGPGWSGYQSQDLADLVTRAHQAGDRVVLTATCFDQAALDQLADDPTAGARLGANLVQLIEAKNLDGVNVDFEGQGPADRSGLDTLMAGVAAAVRQADPHDQVTMDTYASSAGDPSGFYDIAGLAPSVDAFFVMAYDMNSPTTPSPTAPLSGAGFSDLDAVEQYVAAVGPSKVLLGVPYYGYDWPTAGPGLGDPATGPATPVSYATVAAAGAKIYWDATTETPWTSYLVGTQWHQTFFDDPTSLALKAELADTFHLAGLGIWAMGMEGDSPGMQAALDGAAPVVKDLVPGPVATTTTTTTTTAAPGASATTTAPPPGTTTTAASSSAPTTAVPATTDPTTTTTEPPPGWTTTTTSTTAAGTQTSTPGTTTTAPGG